MPFALHPFKLDYTSRRFVVWMAIGTAFILTLVAADFFTGAPLW